MITGTRRGAAGVENTTPAEKLAKTMATKSIDAAPAPANNDEFPPLRVKKLVPEALLPVRGSAGAAGYDLASKDVVVPARDRAVVPTGLAIAAPTGTYARIAPRSGLAVKKFIDTGAGVVDEDYRGEVGVVLFNHSGDDFHVKAGDRVAQLILERIATPAIIEVEDLDDTARGAGGYGSTGVKS